MRRSAWGWWLLLVVVSGCTSRFVDFAPDEEAIYAQPIDEVWPQVRAYFRANGFAFREVPGGASLETEWREEFAGSRVSAYWHRYLVTARPEGPHRCKLVITRESRSVNKALKAPGSELLWVVDGRTNDNPSGIGSPMAAMLAQQQSDEAVVLVGESQQSARDLVLEWKVFRKISPVIAREKKTSSASPDVEVMKDAMVECGVPILGLGRLARAGHVVLLGEVHGTKEVPHFVAQSACQVATQGIPVTVGVEVPAGNQARLETFLASEGGEEDWSRLMESPFWRSPYPDGRNSEAVAYLLEALRKLRAQGLDVRLFAYDHPPSQGEAREEAMARTVLEVAAVSPGRALLVVSGNLHPRQIQGLPWNRDYQPMGLRVARERRDVYSLDVAYKSGTAWICAVGPEQKLDCGVKPARGQDNGDRYFVQLFGGLNAQGYHGIFYVGEVSASTPAVFRGTEPAGDARATSSGR
ncbi:hypothetical protein D187_004011 [Cystobacter fuscus DSM 2262]|uniref:Lipoprotein n=1 Tax=Cystobacter fuscus (strain ATCC 25194 / DSM 2262 / NBRC 100088 / M29) TaxID=1242864 RepID=S9QB43_CYSF2|nr:hypothetical protein [Cystobacter fuscus]EPX58539.1 hypothetical protein D187_004011 [Cystobacter fuscus DSM 2262]